ncbi:MAG: WecB/TagA/CpsF family glycosyltransferase, partial [Phormidesmis sp.]
GAAFRFCSGEVDQAPRWMMKMGLEWAFRLIKEPRRLWQRYVLTNPAFVVLFSLQLIEQYLSSLLKFATRPLTRI